MRTSYKKEDVTVLLTDLTGKIEPLSTEEREKRIQQGMHYSEMLPLEYRPSSQYMALYQQALSAHTEKTAQAVMLLGEKLWQKKGETMVLVSLARAGTPIGILLKRYFWQKYGKNVPHYTISIIRGKGIDTNAMAYLLERHRPETLQFVDGWIGKGAIIQELQKEMKRYDGVDAALAVLADPANMTPLYGTTEDFLIPSSCLNAVVSGLFSRTINNKKLLGTRDFHGAVYYQELELEDVSYHFINTIAEKFHSPLQLPKESAATKTGWQEAVEIAEAFSIQDINFVKPGIGETTRVLLRRMPWKILVRDKRETEYIGHILTLAEEKNIPVLEYPLTRYRACGLIQNLYPDV